MKLFSARDSQAKLKKENEELIDMSVRLQRYFQGLKTKLKSAKSDYEPDKVAKLMEFEMFCVEIQQKKSKLLEELNQIEQIIKDKKEVYYGLIEKQDELEERMYEVKEKERKLDLREEFVHELERKQVEKSK